MRKNIIAAVLAAATVFTAAPTTAMAAPPSVIKDTPTEDADINENDVEGIIEGAKKALLGDENGPERLDAVRMALSMAGTKFRMGALHGPYASPRGRLDITKGEDLKAADASGFISYCLYKSGAKSYTKDYGLSTAALKSIGVETHKDKLKPGDIIVRCNVGKDGYLGNAVMYLGSTEYGNFTIIECNSDKKSDGVVIRGYESFNAFRSRRSRNYKYLRDPFTVKGSLSARGQLIKRKKEKITFTFNAKNCEVITGSAISLNKDAEKKPIAVSIDHHRPFTLYDITTKNHKKIGVLKFKKAEIIELDRFRGTFLLKRRWKNKPVSKKNAYKFAVYNSEGEQVSNTVYLNVINNDVLSKKRENR